MPRKKCVDELYMVVFLAYVATTGLQFVRGKVHTTQTEYIDLWEPETMAWRRVWRKGHPKALGSRVVGVSPGGKGVVTVVVEVPVKGLPGTPLEVEMVERWRRRGLMGKGGGGGGGDEE